MNPEEATTSARPPVAPAETIFTVAQANRALVLVRKVVSDIVKRYARLLELRAQRNEAADAVLRPREVRRLQEDLEATTVELNRLHDELTGIGCVLKDWAGGLVDFPAIYQGRKIWLCWRLGEPALAHWHDVDAGFGGRHPVGPDFE